MKRVQISLGELVRSDEERLGEYLWLASSRDLTTHSTRPRDSIPFIIVFADNVEGCMRVAG
jgi:hypothetical protein